MIIWVTCLPWPEFPGKFQSKYCSHYWEKGNGKQHLLRMLKDSEVLYLKVPCFRIRTCKLAEILCLLHSQWKAAQKCPTPSLVVCAQPALPELQLLYFPTFLSVLDVLQGPEKVFLCSSSSVPNLSGTTWTKARGLCCRFNALLTKSKQHTRGSSQTQIPRDSADPSGNKLGRGAWGTEKKLCKCREKADWGPENLGQKKEGGDQMESK